MNLTARKVEAVLKEQIAKSKQTLAETGYDEVFVRARIAHVAYHRGGPVLDIGAGACSCMAITLAHRRLRVTAVDISPGATHLAQKRSVEKFSESIEVVCTDASHLPFLNDSYRVVVAFFMLHHASDPAAIIGEMFRVSNGLVIISELNSAGCLITRHSDEGFAKRLPTLLAEQCQNCQQFDDTHHVTYVCDKGDTK